MRWRRAFTIESRSESLGLTRRMCEPAGVFRPASACLGGHGLTEFLIYCLIWLPSVITRPRGCLILAGGRPAAASLFFGFFFDLCHPYWRPARCGSSRLSSLLQAHPNFSPLFPF